jgi:Flp pilus assembly protein TadD
MDKKIQSESFRHLEGMRNTVLLVIVFVFGFSCSSNSQDGKAEYMEIYGIHQSGDKQKAIVMLTDYVNKYPNNEKGWTFYGVVLLEDDRDSLAEIAFNKALSIKPTIKQALTGLGVINRMKGNYREAERLYKRSLELDPNFAEAYSSLIVIELLKKDFDEAIAFGQKAWSLDSKNGTTAANLAVAYHFKGEFKSRDEFFMRAKQLAYGDLDILSLVFAGKMTLETLLQSKP